MQTKLLLLLKLLIRRAFARGVNKQVICLCIVVFLTFTWIMRTSTTTSVPYVTYHRHDGFVAKHVKKILMWTPYLSDDILRRERECMSGCSARCDITTNKEDISKADAVDFHLSDVWTEIWSIGTRRTIRFPRYRRNDQVWIISNMEPPPHLWGDLSVLNNVFNWTMWYRTDATVGWPYGASQKIDKTEKATALGKRGDRNIYKEKEFEIIGRISNCADPGRRYRVIRDLQRYLSIDMYGFCYDRPCGGSRDAQDKSCDRLMRKFKFYLAFENSACKDYITEKYWWSLDRDQIPIVNWKGTGKSLPIPGSYINIYDFPDLRALAEYVKAVSANETLYNSYFDWRLEYKNEATCHSCAICHALHDPYVPVQTITNLDGWVRDDVCEKVGIYNNIMKQLSHKLFWYLGI